MLSSWQAKFLITQQAFLCTTSFLHFDLNKWDFLDRGGFQIWKLLYAYYSLTESSCRFNGVFSCNSQAFTQTAFFSFSFFFFGVSVSKLRSSLEHSEESPSGSIYKNDLQSTIFKITSALRNEKKHTPCLRSQKKVLREDNRTFWHFKRKTYQMRTLLEQTKIKSIQTCLKCWTSS